MKTAFKALVIGGALLAGFSATASARNNVSFSLSVGAPVYAAPAYVAPAPVYYAPPPPVVYYRPVPPPVYYGPAWGVAVRTGPGWHHGYHHWHR